MTNRDYPLPSSDAESERLERQAALYGGNDFLRRFVEERPGYVLEVGCGTGVFSRHVAVALPESRVTGIDLDNQRLAYARLHNSEPNLHFELGDLRTLRFADHSFDLVYCRFVLIHLASPDAGLAEMVRITKPGGRVVAYDMVHDGVWFSPQKPAFAKVLGAAQHALRARGMEPNQGLHIAPSMIRCGLEDVSAQVVAHSALHGEPLFEAYRRNWQQTIAGLNEILATSVDQRLVQAALAELEQSNPDQFLTEITVLASGRKPKV